MKKTNKIVLYLLLLLPFCLPEIVYFSSTISWIVRIWKIFVVLYSFTIGLKYYRELSGCTKPLVLMFLYIALVSCFNWSIPYVAAYEISLVILFNHYNITKDWNFLKIFVRISEIFIIANLVTILVYPDGMYSTVEIIDEGVGYEKNWLLGYKNPMIRFMLPACVVSHVLYGGDKGKKEWRAWGLTIISLVTTLLVDSSTGFGGMLLFILTILLYKYGDWKLAKKLFTLKNILIVVLLIDFSFIIIQEIGGFAWIIETVFNRKSDLTGRTDIWRVSIELIKDNPIVGYGANAGDVLAKNSYAHHPHNFLLYTLLQGGIIALSLFFATVIKANKSLLNINDSRLKGAVLGGLSSVLIMGITESLTSGFFLFVIFTFCNNKNRDENRYSHYIPYR